jgi:hypothetical protein
VSVTPADERRSTEQGAASGASADERYVIGVDDGTLSGRAPGRLAGANGDTEHDGIESVVA